LLIVEHSHFWRLAVDIGTALEEDVSSVA